jgi:ABC-type glycerol-3-phosphate transport system substrate-binding protein
MYEIILQSHGWERGWGVVARTAANVKYFSEGSASVPDDVAMGEVAYGLAIDIYAWAAMDMVGGDDLSYVIPDDGRVINPDPIILLKGAPHPELARDFIRFVLSPAGQRLWMLPPGEPGGPEKFRLRRMSVLPELYRELGKRSIIKESPFAGPAREGMVFNSSLAATRQSVLQPLLEATLVQPHAELVAAWEAVLAAPPDRRGAAEAELMRPPITADEAWELATRRARGDRSKAAWMTDPVLRVQTQKRWLVEAIERYRKARKLAGAKDGLW